MIWFVSAFAGTFSPVESASTPAAKAEALVGILDDEKLAEDHGMAWTQLAQTLQGAGYPGAALHAWGQAFADEDQLTNLAAAVTTADQVGDHAVIAEPATSHEGFSPKGDAASRATYVLARHHLRMDRLGPALTWSKKVDKESPAYADAESLRGIVLASQGKHSAALAPLQTSRALGKAQERGQRFDDRLLMNLARTYYGEGNMGQSIYHYATVPRGSEYWPQASFERAWAHFRGGDLAGSLGQLRTHTSPFFADAWYPEAYLLEAQGLFLMCKFATAIETMDTFEKRYEPELQSLDRELGKLDAEKAFAQVETYLDGGSPTISASLLRRYKGEDRMDEVRTAIRTYTDEAKRLGSFGKEGARFAKWDTERATSLRTQEGTRVKAWLDGERDALEQQLTGLELTRVDILQLESRLYERASNTGTLDHGDKVGKLRKLRKTKKGFHVWPFQGEYWADELGWFVVDARSDCPESMARKVEKSTK